MEYSDFFKANIQKLRINSSGQALGLCPLHEDHHPSFSCNLEEGLWKCHGCEKSGNVFQLAKLLSVPAPDNETQIKKEIPETSFLQEIARYTYEDENGKALFQVRRYFPKSFRQFHFDDQGHWTPGLNRTHTVLYKLPEILKSETVYIVEGEKDAETLSAWNIPATCNSMGAGKWKEEYSECLRDKSVVVIPDNDEVGFNHGNDVIKKLWGIAKAIKLVTLPFGKDISEWKKLGGTKKDLARLVRASHLLSQIPISEIQRQVLSSSSKTIQLITLKDLLAEPEEKIDWTVEGLFSKGGLSLIVAKPKTGKSTLARQLALAVSKGESFLGRETEKGLVIYLALEERREDVKSHFRSMGAQEEENLNLKIFAGMAPSDALEQVRSIAEREKPLLIVVDTLARLTRIKDLNDYSQVITGLQPLLAISREVKSHVCLLHHSKKGESKGIDSALGSIGIVGTVDTILEMNRSEKYRTISSIQRSGEDLEETVLSFDKETRISSLGGNKEQCEIDRLGESILEFLSQQEEAIPEKMIDESIEGTRSYYKKALKKLREERKITRIGEGKKNFPYLYSLASKNTGSLVRNIECEPANQNLKNDTSSQDIKTYSGSENISLFEQGPRSHEPVFSEGKKAEDEPVEGSVANEF